MGRRLPRQAASEAGHRDRDRVAAEVGCPACLREHELVELGVEGRGRQDDRRPWLRLKPSPRPAEEDESSKPEMKLPREPVRRVPHGRFCRQHAISGLAQRL